MNKNGYLVGEWIAIISAVITIPSLVVMFIYKDTFLVMVFRIVLVIISVYLYLLLKKMLNSKFKFFKADGLIFALVALLVTGEFISLTAPKSAGTAASFIVIIISEISSIVGIVFGIKLLKLKNTLFGLRSLYAYSNIAYFICLATIIFIPLALVIGIIQDLILAMIFAKVSRNK